VRDFLFENFRVIAQVALDAQAVAQNAWCPQLEADQRLRVQLRFGIQ
jgi:hypothetical protein